MSIRDNGSSACALKLLNRNLVYLQQLANLTIADQELPPQEVVMICAAYTDFWKEFIDGFNPEIEERAEIFRKAGKKPVSISAACQETFLEYLKEVAADITLPTTEPDEGKVWTIVLHGKESTWLQVPLFSFQ
jgi:hypothetical protein